MGEFAQLYKKNFKIWSRSKCGWLCDIITTIVFALVFLLIASLTESETRAKTSYLDKAFRIGPELPTVEKPFPVNHGEQLTALAENKFLGPVFMKNCSKRVQAFTNNDRQKYGFVALAPASNPVIKTLKILFEDLMKFDVKTFDSLEKIQDYVTSDGYGGLLSEGKPNQICMGIAFETTSSNKWEYSVIYNTTGDPQFHDISSFDEPPVVKFEYEAPTTWKMQITSGFAYLVNFIDSEILRESTNNKNAAINTKITYMPTPEFKKSTLFAYSSNGDISTYVSFTVLLLFLGFVYNVLNEKEHRVAQNLSNMGMSLTNYYLSWISFYVSILFLLSIIWLLIVKGSFFPDANIIIVWFLFFLTGLSFIGFGMLIISFFEKAKPGTLCAIVVYFILYGASITMGSMSSETVGQNAWFSLSPIAALAKAGAIVTLVQSYYQPFDFSLLNTELLYYKFSIFVWITLAEFFGLCLLGIYLDQVLPKQTSVRRHPLFCFMKRKSGNKLNKNHHEKSQFSAEDFEDVDEGLKAQSQNNQTLEIKNLKKVYPNGKIAVHDLNLSMYSDQIFALLGHNGAGKTTTISMISGLLPITSGKIKVLGYDCLEDQEKVKTVMGVCPQKNPIYPSLTPREHLILYSTVKKSKLIGKELEEEIDTILKDIDLFDKKNFPAGKLSGGQKRKLCVACAFIGGSKVILLDEPTSGLDVAARRHLWEMLKKYKKDRVIILTTHYMDEADFLGDRIGVMGGGKLLTCGSSLFLKNRFGVGYSLTLVKADSSVSTQKITDVIKSKVKGAELEDDISKEIKYILPTQELDKFEELFKVLEDDEKELGIESFGVSLTTLEDVFLKISERLGEEEKKELDQEIKKVNTIMEDDDTDNIELQKIRVPDSQIFGMHFKALTKKRLLYFKKDLKGLICEVIIPILFVLIGIMLTLIQIIREPSGGTFEPSIFKLGKTELWVNNGFSQVTGKISADQLVVESISQSSISGFDNALMDKLVPERMYAAYFEEADSTTKTYTYTLFSNTTAGNSGVIGMNLINSAILKDATGDSTAEIKMKLSPLPLTDQIKSFESTVDGFLAVFLISLAFSFIPSSLIMFIVNERENNAKHQQIVSGVSISAYWFSSFLIDLMKYLIVAICTMIIIIIFDAEAFLDEGAWVMSCLLLLSTGMSIISFTYITSFMFKSPSSAQIFSFLFSLLTGFILMLVTVILRVIESTRDYSLYFHEWVCSIIPMYQLCFGFYALVTRRVWEIIFQLDDKPAVWSRYSALPQFIYALVMTVVNFAVLFYIESKKSKVKKESEGYQFVEKENVERDGDVIKEEKEVKNSDDYTIKVQDMSKVYTMLNSTGKCCSKKMISRKAAVKNISFGVKKGDCFGLLGTNGAGKTTTFKVLSGEIQPTAGFAQIAGMNVATDMKKIRSLIGYCPQFDALLERLTAREHLEMYAAIKGIPVDMREKMIKKMIKKLNLTKYENVEAGTYSGGNKRKLSVAIALLGNPPIVFLDEPSSGMDPEARRFMWTVVGNISTKRKSSSVVLTTHSMEEAEALSTKLAIMVEGRVKCIGPVQGLKNKYGKGFEIETKIKLPTMKDIDHLVEHTKIGSHNDMINKDQIEHALSNLGEENLLKEITEHGTGAYIHNELKNKGKVTAFLLMEFIHVNKQVEVLKKFMEETFGTVSIIEAYQSFVRWKVEDNVKLSQLFGEMQRNKEKMNLSQYSVKQTSIEQIFIKFANERVADTDD